MKTKMHGVFCTREKVEKGGRDIIDWIEREEAGLA